MINICINSRNYNYSLCQYFNYFYYINKYNTSKLKSILYTLNHNDFDYSKSKLYQLNLKILDDINISPHKSKIGDNIIYQLEHIYQSYFDYLGYTINSYIKINEQGIIQVEKTLFDKIIYNILLNLFDIYKKNKIPYNKTYLVF